MLWILCEIAIAACDLAEVLGAAIALQLLFGIPLLWGVCLTATDVFLVLYLQNRGFRLCRSDRADTDLRHRRLLCHRAVDGAARICRRLRSVSSRARRSCGIRKCCTSRSAYWAPRSCRIICICTPRSCRPGRYGDSFEGKKEAIRYATIDSTVALMSALFINGAILVMAAAVFHGTPHENVADIGDAYLLLDPLLGATVASTLFAVALLFSGQNATLTGTLAGQIVMEGFLNIRLRPWLRRLITRLIAIVPAVSSSPSKARRAPVLCSC